MSEFTCCTTFSAHGYDEYAKNFLESYIKHWDIPLHVYVEGEAELSRINNLKSDLLHPHNLFDIEEMSWFLQSCPPPSKEYRFRVDPFCRKIFALNHDIPDTKWWIWLDADIITLEDVDQDWLRKVCQNEVSYLGRKDWNHSECGFVAYNVESKGRVVLARFEQIYMTGEVFAHLEWHDSYLFDRIREEAPKDWFHNLSEGIPGMHVFDDSVLGEKMRHLKGPLRKKGASLNGSPDMYKSRIENAAI